MKKKHVRPLKPKVRKINVSPDRVEQAFAEVNAISDLLLTQGKKYLHSITQGPAKVINICQLAQNTGLHQSNLYEVIEGTRPLSPSQYIKIERFLEQYGTKITADQRRELRKLEKAREAKQKSE